MDLKFEDQVRKFDNKQAQYHSEVMTKFDTVVKILSDIREKQLIHIHQTEQRFENHEKRIEKLEKLQPTT